MKLSDRIEWLKLKSQLYIFQWLKAISSFVGCEEDVSRETLEAKPIKKPKKRRKVNKHKIRSIKELRHELDIVYNELKYPDYFDSDGYSINVDKHTVKALRELGVFLLTDTLYDGDAWINNDRYEFVHAGLPTILFLKVGSGEDMEYNYFRYAIKTEKKQVLAKIEWPKKTEDVYEVGYGWAEDNPPKWAAKYKNSMPWVFCFHAIDRETGKSRVLRHKEVTTKLVGSKWGRKGLGQQSIPVVSWFKPLGGDSKDGELAALMNIWAMRDSHWQVQARRDGNKVTMCIPQNEAKDYFRDRYVMDGMKRKAIMHWVIAHQRKTKKGMANVKTHIRGARKFKWGKYDINIMLPHKHSFMLSTEGPASHCLEFDEDESKTVSLEDAMTLLGGEK